MSSYRGFTEAQAKAHKKYMENIATIQLRTTPAQREQIKKHAAAAGESVNQYILRAVAEAMAWDRVAILDPVSPDKP